MLQIVLLAGKFVFLIILFLFIYRVVRSTSRELRSAAPSAGRQTGFAPAATGPSPTPSQISSAGTQTAGGPPMMGAVRGGGGGGMWMLVVEKSPTLPVGEAYSLPPGTHALVGRAPEMDIYLDDTFVSSKHALFETTAAGLQVEDLRSTNGTQVNGADISGTYVLHEGDRVEIGDTVFRVEAR